MKKTYLDYVNEIFGARESTLKELFSTLFLEINKSLPDEVETFDPQLIDELKTWADQQDFNKTLQRFIWNHFTDDRISTILHKKNLRFSIKSLRSIFDNRKLQSSSSLSRLKNAYEQDFKIISLEEYATIADHLIYWRNKASHRGGIRNVSQALAIYSEISLLIKIYPDNLKARVDGLDDYQKFLDEGFFESILSASNLVKDNQPTEPEVDLASQIDDEILLNLELETLRDSVNDLTKISNENSSMFDSFKKSLIQIGQAINQTNLFLSNQKEVIEDNSSEIDDLELDQVQLNQSEILDLDFDSLEQELQEDISIDEEDMLPDIDYSTHLTSDEILEKLLTFRDDIHSHMQKKYSSFKPWHNICQSSLAEVLAHIRPKSADDFMQHEMFQYYYNSEQLPQKIRRSLSDQDLMSLKEEAMSFMKSQLTEYWESIQLILHGETQSTLNLDDFRRVYLFTGLVTFPSRVQAANLNELKMLVSDDLAARRKLYEQDYQSKYALIFLTGLNDALKNGNIDVSRGILQNISNYLETDYEEKSLYNQFFKLIGDSTSTVRFDLSTVIGGASEINSKAALERLFGFEHQDFIDAIFGDHGWERLPSLSARKQSILSLIDDHRLLTYKEILEDCDKKEELHRKQLDPSI